MLMPVHACRGSEDEIFGIYCMLEILLKFYHVHPTCFTDLLLADHFGGKLQLGYMQIREKLGEL